MRSSIVALAKEDTKWIVLKPDFESAPTFNVKKVQSQLKNVAAAHSRGAGDGAKLTRVLLITSGYTDVTEVVRTIQHHPDWKVASTFTIASVSCCVDPANTFWQSRRTFPMLLEQAAAGWCSSIILTGEGRESCEKRPRSARDASSNSSQKKKKSSGFSFADLLGGGGGGGGSTTTTSTARPKSSGRSGRPGSSGARRTNSNIADIATSLPEWLLRKANPDARVVRAEDGRIVDESAFEDLLALDNFNDPKMSAQRSLGCPGWTLATEGAAGGGGGGGGGGASAEAAASPSNEGAFTGIVVFLKVALDKLQFAKRIQELQKTTGLGDDSFSEGPMTPASPPLLLLLPNHARAHVCSLIVCGCWLVAKSIGLVGVKLHRTFPQQLLRARRRRGCTCTVANLSNTPYCAAIYPGGGGCCLFTKDHASTG